MQGERNRKASASDEYFTLNINQLRTQLANAPTTGQYSKPIEISIPVLKGGTETFLVYSLPVVVPELASKYQLGSYVGVGKNDPSKYLRFSLAPNDFQSMMLVDGKYQFIEPANKDKSVYRVFYKTVPTGDKAFKCSTEEDILSKQQLRDLAKNGKSFSKNPTDFSKNSDKKYRTMRLAMSVTAEYTAFFGGVPQALTAINATLTRVNGVFEKDFGLHLNLQSYPQLIYTNAATDPYSNAAVGAAGAWNQELQTTLTAVVGNANYDIGHLFGASGGGGNAGCIGCVCVNPTGPANTAKGSGYTSPADAIPQGDNFDIDYVAHEMGHQLGGNHTFSQNIEGTGVNMEPGSGSTIMGYAGITGPNTDVQAHSDGYFHVATITQVQNNLINKTCDVETPTTNNPPVFTALPTYNIPKGTAFVLSATATDAENDPMTFTWEQGDNATNPINSGNLGNTTNGAAFRSVVPTATGNVRYFPRLSSVLAGTLNNANNLWEAVPTVARTMQFAVTARDNHPVPTQQQTRNAVQNLVVGNDGPFTITSTTGSNNVASPITWNVANTAAAPYNVANVKIDYTIDGGATWVTLLASTPNDGTENVTFAGVANGVVAKVRVSAINNVFYAIGNATINAVAACTTAPPTGIAVSAITQTSASVVWTTTTGGTYILQYRVVGSPTWTTVNPATTPTALTGLLSSSQYEVQIATICAGVTGAFSASTNFTTLGLNYCTPTSTFFDDEWIANVTMTPTGAPVMNSASGGTAYSDYTTDPSRLINLLIGTTNNQISVGKGFNGSTFSEGVTAWIDFNRNGIFEASEIIFTSAASTTTPVTGTFTVPAGAYAGGLNTRMRVIMEFASQPNDPCSDITFGEIEDYAVKLLPNNITCNAPSTPAVSAITSTTATISWIAPTPAPALGYEYYVTTVNVAPTAATVPTGTSATTSVNLTGLTVGTTYYFWVRAKCSASDSSLWAAGPSFSTGQLASNLPYMQPFTGSNDFVFVNGSQTNRWVYGAAAGNPANAIYISNDNGATNTYGSSTSVVQAYKDLIIPAGTNSLSLSYDWKAVGEGSFDYFRVWLVPTTFTPVAGTQITAGAGRIQLGANINQQSTWQTYFNPALNVATFAGQTMRLVFEWRNDGSIFNNPPVAIDNINVVIPSCQVPTTLTFNSVTATSATIAWTAASPAPALGYQYYISTTNTPPTAATVPTGNTTATSVNLTALVPNTTYYFWVRSACTATDSSLWMNGGNFSTGQIPAPIPYSQPFTGPNDWGFVNGTQNNKWVYGSAVGNPANSIYISNDDGVTNAYSNSASVVQAYRDIIVPAGSTIATFTFDWKALGEGNFDYFRVWLVPTTTNPVAGTQIAAGPGRIQIPGNFNQQTNWQTYFNPTLNISSFAGQTMRIVFEWRNDSSVFNNPPVAIDNINLVIPTCQVPTNLTANPVGSTTATINWTAASPVPVGGYQYYFSTINTPPTGATIPSGTTATLSAALTGLTPNTTYYFWVRSKCAGTDASLWMSGSFTTGQIPAPFPYINPFTDPIDFTFTGGTQVNKWEYGAATGNTGNSIYISNDAGVSNAYTVNSTSVVQAYRDIAIPAGTNIVQFSFDWKAQGESSFDYLRVWLVPTTFQPVAGTQINAGGGRVQVGTNFNQQAAWQTYNNLNLNLTAFAGQTMRLVFEWRNDGSGGTQPPAAVDNIKFVRCSNATPIVTVSNVLSTTADLTWPQDPNGATYLIRYRPIGSPNWLPAVPIPVGSSAPALNNTFQLTGLSPVTMYEAEVAAVCNGVAGAYAHVEFETRCDPTPPGNLVVTNVTSNSATVTWNTILTATYILQYREVGSTTWTTVNLPVTTYALTGLTPYTTYEVQVASICSGATNPFSTSVVFTTEPICEMAPIGLTVTNLTISSAQVDWNSFPNATYVLKYREVGFNNWVTVNLNTNTYLITGLTEETQYEIQVANVCGGTVQTFTAPYIFTTPTIIYCDMSSVNSSAEYISNVTVVPNVAANTPGAIALPMVNDSGASSYTSYVDDHLTEVQLIQGSTNNTISISKKWNGSTTYDEAVTVWIDFNRDGVFSNNERILTSGANKTTPVTATFNVPANAFVSLVNNRFVTMRVAMSRDGAPVMCGQFQNGEVEDYKVRIIKPTSGNLIDANSAIIVYPNPVKNILNVTKVKDGAKYTIYNAIGQLVMKGTLIANKIDVSRLINGVFIIDIDSPDDKGQVKFIKE